MRTTYQNGYGMKQDDYDSMVNWFYDYEEYERTQKDMYKDGYDRVEQLLSNYDALLQEQQNAITGWKLSKQYYERMMYPNPQLSITDACQLKCKHCYNQLFERENKFLSLDDIKMIDEKVIRVSNIMGNTCNYMSTVIITGGEPTLHPQFADIIYHYINKVNRIAILTNGICMPDEYLAILASNPDKFRIQVSIDGDEETHDMIRGKGSFQKSLATIRKLGKHGLQVHVAFTANNNNYKQFAKMANMFADIQGVTIYWQDRYVREPGFDMESLGPDETSYFFRINAKLQSLKTSSFKVANNRTLMDGRDLPCTSGTGCVIDTFGNHKACGRLNIKIANYFTDTPEEIAEKIKKFIIGFRSVPVKCFDCRKVGVCMGGSCCVSFAENMKANIHDPGCDYIDYKHN